MAALPEAVRDLPEAHQAQAMQARWNRESLRDRAYLAAARQHLDRVGWNFDRRLDVRLMVEGRTRNVRIYRTKPEMDAKGYVLVCNGRGTPAGMIRKQEAADAR